MPMPYKSYRPKPVTLADIEAQRRREEAEEAATRAELKKRLEAGESLTDILLSQQPKPPQKTADEKEHDAVFVNLCRTQNPFTKRYGNVSHQLRLVQIDKAAADELREAAQYEDVDFTRANPGLADMDRAKLAKEIVTKTVSSLRKGNALVGEDFVA